MHSLVILHPYACVNGQLATIDTSLTWIEPEKRHLKINLPLNSQALVILINISGAKSRFGSESSHQSHCVVNATQPLS